MNDFDWIEEHVPTKIYEGAKFVVDRKSKGIMSWLDKTVIVIEIKEVCHNYVVTYSTSNVGRYHQDEKEMPLKEVEKLVGRNYWQDYKGEHIE